MCIIPNNKLSNHYVKKKIEKTVWIEDQTVSVSFRQNIENMQEKTKIGVFYGDYLSPSVSFSDNYHPNIFGIYSDMPRNDDVFNNSVMNTYDNNNGVIGIEGMNNIFGGDIEGLGSNNNFVEDIMFNEQADCQKMFFDWTVMAGYNVNSDIECNECDFGVFDAGQVSSLSIGLSTGVSIPTLSWEGITYSQLVINIGSQTYTNIESGWNTFEFIKSVDGLTWALGQTIGFDAKVTVTDAGGETTTITLHRDGLLDAWEINGYDNDDDGIIDVDLPGYGANPLIPDIFIEVDWMTGHEPVSDEEAEESVARVLQLMFSGVLGCVWEYLVDGPIAHWLAERLMEWFNWYGTFTTVKNLFAAHGINVHIDDGNMGGGGEIAYEEKFPESWEDYYNSKFTSERHRVFHYCVIANLNHEGSWFIGGQGGCPEYTGWTNMFVIYDGAPLLDQSSAFMHELGHNLLGGIDAYHRSTSYFDNAKETHCNDMFCVMFYTDFGQKGRDYCSHCWEELIRDGVGLGL